MPSVEFGNLKIIIEKQILVVIDFLLLDRQITPLEVRHISQFVLKYIDTADTKTQLYSSFSDLLAEFSVLSGFLQNTANKLASYSYA
jgi:hypothetical protein